MGIKMLKSGILALKLIHIIFVSLVVSSPLTNNTTITNSENVTILDEIGYGSFWFFTCDFAPNYNNITSSDISPAPDHLESWKETWHKHNQTITRVYLNTDCCVAIYFDKKVIRSVAGTDQNSLVVAWFRNNPHWLFNFTSNVWAYMNTAYGKFGPDHYLHLVIHQGNVQSTFFNYSIHPRNSHKYNILDITLKIGNALNGESTIVEEMDLLTNKLAYFVERSSHQRFGFPSPSNDVWKIPSSDETAWTDIFTFDVYTNLNLSTNATRYKAKLRNGFRNSNSSELWFQDWFLPIYSKFGGNFVLNNYFKILSYSIPPRPPPASPIYYTFENELNMGEFIHLWSAAANTNLKELAVSVFKWNTIDEEQFSNARKKYPYNYTRVFSVNRTDTTPAAEHDHKQEHETLVGISVAVSVTAVVLFILIPSLIYYRRKIKNLQTEIRALTNEEVTNFFEGDRNVNENEAESLILSMPFIKDFEIPREKMIIDTTKVLGSGQYGTVIHGFLRDCENDQLVSVAMKTVKENVNVACFKTFLSEVKIMAYLGKHENIVDLLGTCTANIKNREIFLALEYCPLGNLENFLKENRNNFEVDYRHFDRNNFNDLVLQFYSDSNTCSRLGPPNLNKIRTVDLLKWSQEISNAMMYLTVKKVIHGDLATRNILLTENRVAKISDFGLSRQFLNYASYMKKSKQPVPWRWLAIECLKDKKFSTASDVWAFGVTMWEIFSLAEVPYGGYTYDLFFLDKLINGDRLLVPTHANPTIYQIMKDCWEFDPKKRPTFNQIHNILGQIILDPGKFIPVNYASIIK